MRTNTGLLIALQLVIFVPQLVIAAQPVNSWTNPASARWEDPFWSLGTLPDSTQSVMITNAGYKAVEIGSATSAGFANSMTIGSLDLSAPTNGFSTLLLNYAGASVPLKVLNGAVIGTNAMLMNLYSTLEVDGSAGGKLSIQSGKLIEEGGSLVATNVTTSVDGGSMELTNAFAILGPLALDTDGGTNSGTVNQSGGQMSCDLSVVSGTYNLVAGSFFGTCSVSAPNTGRFVQYGGTNFATQVLGKTSGVGLYRLFNGAVISPAMTLGSSVYSVGEFGQAGGLVKVDSLTVGSGSFGPFKGSGIYYLTNGTLLSGTVSFLNGSMVQAGGEHIASNGISLSGNFDHIDPREASYSLSGGNLTCPFVGMRFASFTQSGGTNHVSQDLGFDDSTYTLSGGVLLTSNTVISFGYYVDRGGARTVSQFLQTGGRHQVSNTLTDLDEYALSGGVLAAGQIVLRGTLSISNAASIESSGSFDFGGVLRVHGSATETLGPVLLSGNSTIDLESGAHTLAFANSSMIAWTGTNTLTITNWNGLANGGGADQLLFGNTAAGLSSSQLDRIQFVNPAGFPPGQYPARILSTGEVVPAQPLQLGLSHSANNLRLTWTSSMVLQSSTNVLGPYTDVPGATSPYTNTAPQGLSRFFRLRP